jgi:hypothetical protein
LALLGVEGKAGAPVTVVLLPREDGRRRRAARRAAYPMTTMSPIFLNGDSP